MTATGPRLTPGEGDPEMTDQLAPPTCMNPILASRIRGIAAAVAAGSVDHDQPTEVRLNDVAPMPDAPEAWTAEVLIRYYAARASAHQDAVHKALRGDMGPQAAFTMARNGESSESCLATALLLHVLHTKAPELVNAALEALWDVTAEAGALNGEWEDVTEMLLRRYGVTGDGQVVVAEPIDVYGLSTEVAQ